MVAAIVRKKQLDIMTLLMEENTTTYEVVLSNT